MRNRIAEEFEKMGILLGYPDDPTLRTAAEIASEDLIESFYQNFLEVGITVDGVAHEFTANKEQYQAMVDEING